MCECIKNPQRTWDSNDCPRCAYKLDLTKPLQTRDGRAARLRRDSGNGYKLPTPLPDIETEELLAWAKGVTIKSLLN